MKYYTIEIDHNQCDRIVLESLKDAYKLNAIPDKIDCSNEDAWVDTQFLNALDMVIHYYCSHEEKKQWIQEKKVYDAQGT